VICRHFGVCGGCETQEVAYPDQLARKRDTLQALFDEALGRSAPEVRPVRGMPPRGGGQPWHFRHKAAFVFGTAAGRGGGLVMGHFAARSGRVIAVEECPVHAARANRLAFALCGHLRRAGLLAAGEGPRGVLRHVIVRTARDEREAVMLLVVSRNDPGLRAPVRAFLREAAALAGGPPSGFLVNVNARPGPYMIGDTTIRVHGRPQVRDRIGSLQYLSSPAAFFQTNPDAADMIVDEVVRAAGPPPSGATALDLYAGGGLLALPLAAAGWRVTAVEEHADAVRDGAANARLNRMDTARVRFVRARVEDSAALVRGASPQLVVLDPPRTGCPPAVIASVFRDASPQRAVYVSCNPEALARELPAILAAGYRIDRVQPVDMFPHTGHIETVVGMTRGRR
jgi:23S rRNA (uracil1939-C5)-methyltransferase